MFIIAQTNRVTIREYSPNELETYLNHFTDERVALYIPKRSREERIGFFNDALNRYRATKTQGMWGIFNHTNAEFIGGCLLREFNDDPNVLEIGYSIEHKYWGQGIATEMVVAIAAYGLTNTNIKEIVAVTELPNIASQRVLNKAGFKRVENLVKDGEELAFFKLSG